MGEPTTDTPSDPRWGEDDSDDFLGYGDYFVPDRERQVEMICDLVPAPPEGGWLVELCCGEGLLTEALLGRFPGARVLGLDGSPRMVEHARARLAPFADRVELAGFDLADRSWRSTLPSPLHAAVSSLAVHHLDGAGKRRLFRDLADRLAPGGVLVLADVVLPADDRAARLAADEWDRAVRERALARDGHLGAFEAFRRLDWNSFRATEPDPVDQPDTLLDQLRWLEEAGFEAVDVYWMRAGHALFGGVQPPAASGGLGTTPGELP